MPITVRTQISGTVYRDIPVNGNLLNTYGVKDANEEGVKNVKVTIFPSGKSTLKSANGQWSLPATDPVRIEFSDWPIYLRESIDGNGFNSSIQFGGIGSVIDFGLFNPADYNNTSDPQLITSEFISGFPQGGGTAGDYDAWFLFNYTIYDL